MEHLRLFQFLTWKSPIRPSCYRKLRASTLTVPPTKPPRFSPPCRTRAHQFEWTVRRTLFERKALPTALRSSLPRHMPATTRSRSPCCWPQSFARPGSWSTLGFGKSRLQVLLQAPTLPISSPESQKPLEMLTLSLRALSRCSRDTLTVRPGLGSETRQATQVGAQGVRELPNDCRHRRCDTGSSCLRKGICSRRVGGA